jgi:protein gp37
MADASQIEWTDATWNPVTGCTKVSPGCDNCYAARFSERFRGTPGHPFETGFDLTLRPARLPQPLAWTRPRKIFVNFMSDLFHKDVPRTFVNQVFDTMEQAHRHTFQLLTKRSSLMRDYLKARYDERAPPHHIWLGVSIEDRDRLSRIRHLQQAPGGIRFLSIEPLIGRIGQMDLAGIDWVIVGGESGPGARPIAIDWVREVRDQCVAASIPFFFKQWGGFRPKQGGRILDGREWNEYPTRRGPMPMAAECAGICPRLGLGRARSCMPSARISASIRRH